MIRSSLWLFALCVALTGCSYEPVNDSKSDSAASLSTSTDQPIRVVAFDEHEETLQAIIDGEIHGTVVQNPYMYGYKSVEVLAKLAADEPLPDSENGFLDLPARQIRKADADSFWKDMKQKLKTGEGEPDVVEGRRSVAYVTNGIDPFWNIAAAGAIAAGREFDVNVLLRFPPKGVGDQKNMLEALLVQDDVTGIAVSPIDPKNQGEILNQCGDQKHYITHDSDAPDTNRLMYIGMNNYDAGRMAGQLVKEAMPDGGSVMIFVGRLGQLNAEQRRQGLIDELLDRSRDPSRRDANDEIIEGEKYTILGTKLDNFDKAKAKQNAQDTISKYPDVGCMVGLFAYNPPLCLQAIREAGREVRPSSN
ncbi:MAG: substrate-binding domain-containing protein [bacterium]|nr:substrate-binding domain-containing protein [bacterium]